jgi:hypothetical protein
MFFVSSTNREAHLRYQTKPRLMLQSASRKHSHDVCCSAPLHDLSSLPSLYMAIALPCAATCPGLPLIILGSITFLPGAYHTRLAYLAWRGYSGYSLDQIPDF